MRTKKLAIIFITIALAFGTGFAVFAADNENNSGKDDYYACSYDDAGHMNDAHYQHMHNVRHHDSDDRMGNYMDDHMGRHIDGRRHHHMDDSIAHYKDNDQAPIEQ